MSDRKRAAPCTSFAAARAWRPSLCLMSRVRSVNTRLLRSYWPRGGLGDRGSLLVSLIASAACGRQQVGGHADGLGALLGDDVRQAGHVPGVVLHRGELDEHRKVHSRHDLDATLLQERKADVARCPAEHVGKGDHSVVVSDTVEAL